MLSKSIKILNRNVDNIRSSESMKKIKPTRKKIFSIGLYAGKSLTKLSKYNKADNPVLSAADIRDVPALYVADPFVHRKGNILYMFFEVFRSDTNQGEIGCASSNDNGCSWQYEGIVLTEAFHLSYPFILQYEGEVYMIPESNATESVRIYKSTGFPLKWEYYVDIAKGKRFSDSTIFFYDDYWYMFVDTSDAGKSDTLSLYFSKCLFENWQEHPESPIIKSNHHFARPAGRVIYNGDKILRFAQDCSSSYGLQVYAFEILKLSKTDYMERMLSKRPIIKGSGSGWNAQGMHHIELLSDKDNHYIVAVDGWVKL
jgi:hypothetical protein